MESKEYFFKNGQIWTTSEKNKRTKTHGIIR